MKQVTKYEDDDGRLHDTPEQAQQADRGILAKKQLNDVLRAIDAEDHLEDLWEWRATIQKALRDA